MERVNLLEPARNKYSGALTLSSVAIVATIGGAPLTSTLLVVLALIMIGAIL